MHLSSRFSLPALALAVAMIGATAVGFAQTGPSAMGGRTGMTYGGMTYGGMTYGGMMNGGMGQMMAMMMGDRGGTMVDRVESRLVSLKAELKITDAQAPQWDRFAEALRSSATSMSGMQQQMMQGGVPASLPDRLDLHEQMLSAHLDRVKDINAALDPLYAAMSDDQKKLADRLIMSPMGMM